MLLKGVLRRYKTPEIINTDQGSQYTGNAFTGTLKEHGVKIIMDGKGRCRENIFIDMVTEKREVQKDVPRGF